MIWLDDGKRPPIPLPSGPPPRDNRVTCRQCANFSRGHCEAWQQLGAARGYSPIASLPRRCEAFKGRGR